MEENRKIKIKKPRAQKRISLSEFRAWLSGVEDMQPNNWSPTKEQWKTIREKIELISEPERPPERWVGSPQSSAFLPESVPVSSFPMQNLQLPPPPIPQHFIPNSEGVMKTPDVNGPYTSNFE